MNIFECSNCGKSYFSNLDVAFVCKHCHSSNTLSKVNLFLTKDIGQLSDKDLKVEHYKLHKLYTLNKILKSMKVSQLKSKEEIVKLHIQLEEELFKRGMSHKKLDQLDIAKYGTSEGATRAWDSRGRGRKEEPKGQKQPSQEQPVTSSDSSQEQLSERKTRGHVENISTLDKKSRYELIANDLGEKIDSPKVKLTEQSIKRFTEMDYRQIRAVQTTGAQDSHGNKYSDFEEVKAYGKAIEDYIEKAPKYDEPIFRGVTGIYDKADSNTPGIDIAKLKVGRTIDMKGTSSWTTNAKMAKTFGNVIFVSSNVSKAVSITGLSAIGGEKEVLVSKKLKFKIDKIKQVTLRGREFNGATFNPTEKNYTVVRVSEVVKKNLETEISKAETTEPKEDPIKISLEERLKQKIESDMNILIEDENGQVVYEYPPKEKNLDIKHVPKLIKSLPREIKKYGTSEGAVRAWDSRGRGQKEQPKATPKPRKLESATFEGRVDHVMADVDTIFSGTEYNLDSAEKAIFYNDPLFRTNIEGKQYMDVGVWQVRNRVLDVLRESLPAGKTLSGEEVRTKVKEGLNNFKSDFKQSLVDETNYYDGLKNKGSIPLYRVGEFGDRRGEKGVFFTPNKLYAQTYEGLKDGKVANYKLDTSKLNIYQTEDLDSGWKSVFGSERPSKGSYADDEMVDELWRHERKLHTKLKQQGYDGISYANPMLDNGFGEVTGRKTPEFSLWNRKAIDTLRGKDIASGREKVTITRVPNNASILPTKISKRFIMSESTITKIETVPEMSPEIKAPTQFPYKRRISRKIPKNLKVSK